MRRARCPLARVRSSYPPSVLACKGRRAESSLAVVRSEGPLGQYSAYHFGGHEGGGMGRSLCLARGPRRRHSALSPDLSPGSISHPVTGAAARNEAAFDARGGLPARRRSCLGGFGVRAAVGRRLPLGQSRLGALYFVP